MFKGLKVLLASFLFSSFIYAAEAKTNDKFTITTIDDKKIEVIGTKDGLTFPQFKNQVVIVEFWGTHCPPCLMSIPHYINLTKEYKDKFKLLAIEVQMTPKEQLLRFVKAKNINYPVFEQAQNMDFVRYLSHRAGWRGAIPFMVAFDKNGRVLTIQKGMVSEEFVKKVIEFGLQDNSSKTQTKDQNKTKDSNKTK
jgi:thiol-disulfide isomerase/thioredoxin